MVHKDKSSGEVYLSRLSMCDIYLCPLLHNFSIGTGILEVIFGNEDTLYKKYYYYKLFYYLVKYSDRSDQEMQQPIFG
ncbi:MAG: hypothetical protein KatS3mg083_422 [Candidatus Dojkabacteria bacterium]|nr:MAG: hypothetical protein KatS3mg083_422 [Candidatus Dojkabacteria bacterium]